MKALANIEYSNGLYSVFTEGYGFHGFGDTEGEARRDFLDAYHEFREKGWCNDELEFEFRNLTELEAERDAYRMKCKHHWYDEICCLKSGWNGDFHMTFGCDGKCRRIKNWDKKHNYHGKP